VLYSVKQQPDLAGGCLAPGITAQRCGSFLLLLRVPFPLLEEIGIEGFIRREVWVDGSKTQIGHEISLSRHFYMPQPLRTLGEIRADILALENETQGLLGKILGA
jgi:hypothetical protein